MLDFGRLTWFAFPSRPLGALSFRYGALMLGRADTINLTQWREGAKMRLLRRYSRFLPVIPALSPRHSRESGNPDGCNQARHPKSSMNRERQIPSPLMGL